jgi:hypothetical protein
LKAKPLRKPFALLLAASGVVACVSMGAIAAGLLYEDLEEHHPLEAVLLFLVALLGAAGAFFFLFWLLKQISQKPKG